jgi:hypothetical protein
MRKARAIGESLGMIVHQQNHDRHTLDIFADRNTGFGFDQLWLCPNQLLFVQVKTNLKFTPKVRQPFQQWVEKYHFKVGLMSYFDGGGWSIWLIHPNTDEENGVFEQVFAIDKITPSLDPLKEAIYNGLP